MFPFTQVIFRIRILTIYVLFILAFSLLPFLNVYAQKIPCEVVFYGSEEKITVWVDGAKMNEEPQLAVTLKDAPVGNHEVSIYFADTSMNPIEHYAMGFREGFSTRYKLKRKSIPYKKPKFFLQFFEEKPLAYIIKTKIEGMKPRSSLKLYAIRGDAMLPLVQATYDSLAIFVLPVATPPGMLRLQYGEKDQMDFIFNKENIRFSFNKNNPFASLDFQQSQENQLYFTHLRNANHQLQKMSALYQLLASYPDQDDYYALTKTKFDRLQTQMDSTRQAIDTLYHASFANALIQHSQPYFPVPTTDREQYNQAIRNHYFDNFKLDDPRLINSSLYANKIAEYMGLWVSPRVEQGAQNKLFQQGTDILLGNASAHNEAVFEYVAKQLQTLFKQISNDDMVYYIDNTWLANDCKADELEQEKIAQRIEAYQRMQVGNIAPDFTAPDLNGKPTMLTSIQAPLKLLVFWASWCEHCQAEIPTLKPLYEKFKLEGVEIVAVSLDKDRATWAQFVKDHQLNWINVSELQGFNSPIANEYYIYKTPSYLLLDKNNKILSKPRSAAELQAAIQEVLK